MEKMVGQRLKWYLEYHSLLDINQSVFRARRITMDHIVRLHDAVQQALANKHNVLAVFIDIENAYDMVNKTVLLSKLLALGINGEMLRFIQSLLSCRTFQAGVGSSLSCIKEPENGTPQGSIRGPLLFSVMINDVF